MERFGRFVKSMDDSAKHIMTIAENSVRKYQGCKSSDKGFFLNHCGILAFTTAFKKEYLKLGGSFIALAKSFEFDERPGENLKFLALKSMHSIDLFQLPNR
jgi:sorting nexin-9/18/33